MIIIKRNIICAIIFVLILITSTVVVLAINNNAKNQDEKNFQIILDAYGIYIEGIKDFIEKKHPDATFNNKLKTARNIFYQNFCRRKISFNKNDIKNYLDYMLSEKENQKEILETYYKICKNESK